jgi:hypothetical protein
MADRKGKARDESASSKSHGIRPLVSQLGRPSHVVHIPSSIPAASTRRKRVVSLYLDDENEELQTSIDDRLGNESGTRRVPSPELCRFSGSA